jgi:hypothetical protein
VEAVDESRDMGHKTPDPRRPSVLLPRASPAAAAPTGPADLPGARGDVNRTGTRQREKTDGVAGGQGDREASAKVSGKTSGGQGT